MSIISLKQALVYGTNELEKSNINSARLDAEILLGFVSSFSREKIIQNYKLRIKNYEWEKFKKLILKRKKHYPIAYLTGSKEFYGIDFYVNENVLVPRPETELLVKNVINYCRGAIHCARQKGVINHAPTKILEIGTGSGCIALTLAKYLPKAKITATDISEKALKVARKNRSLVETHCNVSLQNARFTQSDFLQNIKSKPDIIAANLPYLTSKELKEKSISREPKTALYGGKDGLDIYRKLFQQIKNKWYRKGLINQTPTTIFIEIGENQAKSLKKYIQNLFPKAQVEIKKDLAGRDRIIVLKL